MSKELARWECCINCIEADTVYLDAINLTEGEKQVEAELIIPRRQMERYWGRANIRLGRIGYMVLKERSNGKGAMRGWPWTRKWKQADIDAANERANQDWRSLMSDDDKERADRERREKLERDAREYEERERANYRAQKDREDRERREREDRERNK